MALAGLTAVTVVLLAWVPLVSVGRQAAWDSLRSQSAKPAWQTPWALLDGSLGTGTFGEASGRLTPLETQDTGAAGRIIPRWLPPVLAVVLAVLMAARMRRSTPLGGVSFLLSATILLFLASPGWSPQWLAYLVPLILLSLPQPRGALYIIALTAIAVLEWPVLLSRGRFDLLWVPVTIRTTVLILLAADAWRGARLEQAAAAARKAV